MWSLSVLLKMFPTERVYAEFKNAMRNSLIGLCAQAILIT